MIKRVTEEDYAEYESFVKAHPNGHFMQSLSWAKFKRKQKSAAVMSLAPDGTCRGAMLMFLQDVRRTNKKFLYSPRGPVCARDDKETLSELLAAASEIAKELGAYKLTIDPDVTSEDTAFLSFFKSIGARIGDNARDNGILQPFAVYRINVDKSDDELMASFHSKARYSVRTSIKSGAVCRLGTREDIPVFRALLADTAGRDGFTARDEGYFFDMYDALGEDSFKLFIVECENQPCAGSVLLRYGKKTWHMYAGSSEDHKETLPNFLMQWEMMRWSRDNGCWLYDMRGIAGEGNKLLPIEGLVRFKKRFGGELVSFVGRIDIVYNKSADIYVNAAKTIMKSIRKVIGGNKK